jgi:hypothetical protein
MIMLYNVTVEYSLQKTRGQSSAILRSRGTTPTVDTVIFCGCEENQGRNEKIAVGKKRAQMY